MREILEANITHVSFVDKAANLTEFFLMKSKDLNILKTVEILKSADYTKVYGVVYAPNTYDSQGDKMLPEAISKASAYFMKQNQSIDFNHDFKTKAGELVENAIALQDMNIGGHLITKGTWYIAVEPSNEIRAKIDSGEITGFSMAGMVRAIRKGVDEKDGMLRTMFNWLKEMFEPIKENETADELADEVAVAVDELDNVANEVVGQAVNEIDSSVDRDTEPSNSDYETLVKEVERISSDTNLSIDERIEGYKQAIITLLTIINNKKEV